MPPTKGVGGEKLVGFLPSSRQPPASDSSRVFLAAKGALEALKQDAEAKASFTTSDQLASFGVSERLKENINEDSLVEMSDKELTLLANSLGETQKALSTLHFFIEGKDFESVKKLVQDEMHKRAQYVIRKVGDEYECQRIGWIGSRFVRFIPGMYKVSGRSLAALTKAIKDENARETDQGKKAVRTATLIASLKSLREFRSNDPEHPKLLDQALSDVQRSSEEPDQTTERLQIATSVISRAMVGLEEKPPLPSREKLVDGLRVYLSSPGMSKRRLAKIIETMARRSDFEWGALFAALTSLQGDKKLIAMALESVVNRNLPSWGRTLQKTTDVPEVRRTVDRLVELTGEIISPSESMQFRFKERLENFKADHGPVSPFVIEVGELINQAPIPPATAIKEAVNGALKSDEQDASNEEQKVLYTMLQDAVTKEEGKIFLSKIKAAPSEKLWEDFGKYIKKELAENPLDKKYPKSKGAVADALAEFEIAWLKVNMTVNGKN